MRQAISASRGSSGVQYPRPNNPVIHKGANATSTIRIHLEGAKPSLDILTPLSIELHYALLTDGCLIRDWDEYLAP